MTGCFQLRGAAALVIFLLSTGCGAGGRHVQASSAPKQASWSDLMAQGRQFSAQGQSNRAEQYFLAAGDAGAPESQVFEAVVETCVSSGRLGRALAHVERRLKHTPDDVELLRLSASLNEALGHTRLMWERMHHLARARDLSSSHVLYLAEFYDRQGEVERALESYQQYFRVTSLDEQEPWVRASVRRLQASRDAAFASSRPERGDVL